MAVDRSKLLIWIDLLSRKKAVDALKAISTTAENFDWARANLLALAGEPIASTPVPVPPVVSLTPQQAFDKIIAEAPEGTVLNLGPGEFSVTISKS